MPLERNPLMAAVARTCDFQIRSLEVEWSGVRPARGGLWRGREGVRERSVPAISIFLYALCTKNGLGLFSGPLTFYWIVLWKSEPLCKLF